ncbi:MAG: hypothetical protein NTY53_23685 [Kiritimatiellaeota bacterium]|nr:hypothetical protein [Kiritimatiellota bacterium]
MKKKNDANELAMLSPAEETFRIYDDLRSIMKELTGQNVEPFDWPGMTLEDAMIAGIGSTHFQRGGQGGISASTEISFRRKNELRDALNNLETLRRIKRGCVSIMQPAKDAALAMVRTYQEETANGQKDSKLYGVACKWEDMLNDTPTTQEALAEAMGKLAAQPPAAGNVRKKAGPGCPKYYDANDLKRVAALRAQGWKTPEIARELKRSRREIEKMEDADRQRKKRAKK